MSEKNIIFVVDDGETHKGNKKFLTIKYYEDRI